MHNLTLELIITVYNNVVATKCVFESLLTQTDKNFSVAIADDGSGPEIGNLIKEYSNKGLNIRHVYQEDKGFRKARILNKTIASSKADYIVMIDNDIVLERNFIRDHRYIAKPGYFVSGRRVNLGPRITDLYIKNNMTSSWLENRWHILWWGLTKQLKGGEFGFRLPWTLVKLWGKKPGTLIGANFGVWRSDLIQINGFDNEFNGYGCEDVDIEWRLLASGVKRQSLKGRGCGFHLYHIQKLVINTNLEYMENKKRKNQYVANSGISLFNI